jgi:hypothetical protein
MGRNFKNNDNRFCGISSIEYIYSDADHLYRMAYKEGVNDNDF